MVCKNVNFLGDGINHYMSMNIMRGCYTNSIVGNILSTRYKRWDEMRDERWERRALWIKILELLHCLKFKAIMKWNDSSLRHLKCLFKWPGQPVKPCIIFFYVENNILLLFISWSEFRLYGKCCWFGLYSFEKLMRANVILWANWAFSIITYPSVAMSTSYSMALKDSLSWKSDSFIW